MSQLRNLVEDVAILLNNKINNLNLDTHYDNVSNSFETYDFNRVIFTDLIKKRVKII